MDVAQHRVILDRDTAYEIDDQFAIAYALVCQRWMYALSFPYTTPSIMAHAR
jgi:hypothetical protein